jgi:hypothetical protein
MATKDGWLPLHCTCDNVCFYKEPLNVIQFLVEQWPEAVKKSTVNGSLPLHYACSNKAPLEVIQYLVEQWQEAVKKINTSGLTPLNQETRPEVVAWLQDVESGRIAFAVPLKQPPTSTPSKPEPEPKFEHDIASKLTMLDCYDSLVFLFTQIAYMRDLDSLVLCAVYRVVVCEFLSHVHCCLCRFLCLPETVSDFQENRGRIEDQQKRDRIGQELRQACYEQPQSIDKIRSLVKECPEAIKTTTVSGLLPLHFACANKAPLELIQFLVEQWPEAVKKTTNVDGKTPLGYAERTEVIAWLSLLDAIQITDTKFEADRTEIQKAMAFERGEPVAVSQEYIEEILTEPRVVLGEGFFGVVLKGVDTVLNTTFAVKAIHQELVQHGHTADVQAARATFQQELDVRTIENRLLRINSKLSHPHRYPPPTTDSFKVQTPKHCILVRLSLIRRASGTPVPHLRAG